MSFSQSIKKNPLIFYVGLNYLISWTFLYPCYQAILHAEEGSFPLLALIGIPGGFGPSIAAIITVRLTEGKSAMLLLLRKFRSFRVQAGWYLFVLLFPMLVYLIAVISTQVFGFELGEATYVEGFKMALPYVLLALPFGPIMEELGWRGYMLPRLLEKYNIYLSSLILGVVWTFWHLASFTFPGAAIPSAFEVNVWTVSLYLCSITAQTFIFSYVYLKTNGSLILAILLHATFNASSNIILSVFPDVSENVDQRMYAYIIHFIIVFIAALGWLFNFKSKDEK